MENIVTLNKVNRSDSAIAGFRAVDLADLQNKKINIPICFILKTDLFDEYLQKNNIKPQISSIINKLDFEDTEELEEAYEKIKDLILESAFSESDENELLEAYETLAIDMDHIDIAKLVTSIDKPFLTIIGSPNYVDDSENNEYVFQNVKGKNALLKTIKMCWASLYSPKSLKYRKDNDIKSDPKMGIIIQRMIDADISAQAYTDQEEIIVKSFAGYQDYHEEFEKDICIFDKGSLSIKNTKVNFQESKYVRDIKDNTLVKKSLKEEADKQKLNDKDTEELARLTKKIEGILEKPVKVFFSISKNKIYVLFANKVIRKQEFVEEETINHDEKPKELKHEDHDQINIEDDLAFLDEIETLENAEQQEKSDEKPEKKEGYIDWSGEEEEKKEVPGEEPEKEDSFEDEDIGENDEKNFLSEEVPKEPEEDAKEEEKKEVPESKKEETLDEDEIKTLNEKAEREEEDEFIFSEFHDDKEKKPEEKHSSEEDAKEEEKKKNEDFTAETANNSKPEPARKMKEVYNLMKKIVVSSDDTIYESLKKKHLEVSDSIPESFEKAIEGLKSIVSLPFLDEIRKIHSLRNKAEKDEDISIEDATMAARTAKNFLSVLD